MTEQDPPRVESDRGTGKNKCLDCGSRDEFDVRAYPVRGPSGRFKGSIFLCDECAVSRAEALD